MLGDTELIFDQTPEVGLYPSTTSSDTDEDDVPLKWELQRRMVPISLKGKETVTKETPKRRPFTRAVSQKLMGDSMKSSETTTKENQRRRRSGDVAFELPTDDVVDVSIDASKNECVDEDSPLANVKKGKGKQVKKTGKGKFRATMVKKINPTKGKGNDSQKKWESLKRKRETSPGLKQDSAQGPGTKRNKDDKVVSKQTIVDNMRLQKVLGGRVFDIDIFTKLGMDSLSDLVEIQSWTHLFRIKSHVLNEKQV
ncbi:hypothetical protein H5410_014603 [Solanum commersonii]|uniref:Uncharacterized protein n=1 Tax=Solanum commersonii TaxID=4109 RepID=A0A9J5ZRP8_SOLCO|nr:hypothetical protein H5410_014603 [Solanum commersonii]